MRTVLAVAASAALVLLVGCDGSWSDVTSPSRVDGSGTLVTESRPVQGFNAVNVSGAARLIIEQTGVDSLEVTAEDNVLPYVRTEVAGDVLVLGIEPGVSLNTTRGVEYRVTVRDLTEIGSSGASVVEAYGIDTDELAVILSGASSFSATGAVDRLDVALSGASRFETPDLTSRVATLGISGASYVLIRVRDTLEVGASGASIIEYLGNPLVSATVSGGSVVRRVGP